MYREAAVLLELRNNVAGVFTFGISSSLEGSRLIFCNFRNKKWKRMFICSFTAYPPSRFPLPYHWIPANCGGTSFFPAFSLFTNLITSRGGEWSSGEKSLWRKWKKFHLNFNKINCHILEYREWLLDWAGWLISEVLMLSKKVVLESFKHFSKLSFSANLWWANEKNFVSMRRTRLVSVSSESTFHPLTLHVTHLSYCWIKRLVLLGELKTWYEWRFSVFSDFFCSANKYAEKKARCVSIFNLALLMFGEKQASELVRKRETVRE